MCNTLNGYSKNGYKFVTEKIVTIYFVTKKLTQPCGKKKWQFILPQKILPQICYSRAINCCWLFASTVYFLFIHFIYQPLAAIGCLCGQFVATVVPRITGMAFYPCKVDFEPFGKGVIAQP